MTHESELMTIRKVDFERLTKDAEQWKIYLDGGINNLFEIVERLEKEIKEDTRFCHSLAINYRHYEVLKKILDGKND